MQRCWVGKESFRAALTIGSMLLSRHQITREKINSVISDLYDLTNAFHSLTPERLHEYFNEMNVEPAAKQHFHESVRKYFIDGHSLSI